MFDIPLPGDLAAQVGAPFAMGDGTGATMPVTPRFRLGNGFWKACKAMPQWERSCKMMRDDPLFTIIRTPH